MTVPAIHEDDADELGLPGRQMRWLVSQDAVAGEPLFDVRDSRRAGRQGHGRRIRIRTARK